MVPDRDSAVWSRIVTVRHAMSRFCGPSPSIATELGYAADRFYSGILLCGGRPAGANVALLGATPLV